MNLYYYIILGELIALIILIILTWRSHATRKAKKQNTIPRNIPFIGYNGSGRKIPTKIEELAESDAVEIKKVSSKKKTKKIR